jgi:hypothetical protein
MFAITIEMVIETMRKELKPPLSKATASGGLGFYHVQGQHSQIG